MHLKHLEMMGAGSEVTQNAELAALGLDAPVSPVKDTVPVEAQKAEIENRLMTHTAFMAVAYVLISLGSAICLVEMINQWPKLGMLRWVRQHLAKVEKLRALHEKAQTAALAVDTLSNNRLVMLRTAQDLVIRTHLDGLSYTPWWRNSFRHFHISDDSKINKAQAYALRWLRFIHIEPAKQDLDACHKVLREIKLVQPAYPPIIDVTPVSKEVEHA